MPCGLQQLARLWWFAGNLNHNLVHAVRGGDLDMTVVARQNIMMFERYVKYLREHDDVWFASLSDIYDCWYEAEPETSLVYKRITKVLCVYMGCR